MNASHTFPGASAAMLDAVEISVPSEPSAPSPALSDRQFQDLTLSDIEYQWATFAYFRNLCARKGLARADLVSIVANGDYSRLPSVVSTAFKLSKGLLGDLNDLSAPGIFQVSSSTSGDPSYVYTSLADRSLIAACYGRTFGSPESSVGLGFSPSLRILHALSKKAALKGTNAVLRMQLGLEGGFTRFSEMYVTVDVDIPKTILYRALGRPAAIRKMSAAAVARIVRNAQKRGQSISIGGLALLLRPYLDEFRDGEFHLQDKGYFAFAGGGYSGAKGSIRGEKIDKPSFIARLAAVFGIEPVYWSTHFKDIYSFTETSAQIEGYWDSDQKDFLFRPAPDCRIYIVDPKTEAPLRSGRGLVKVISPSPSGRPVAANAVVLQLDTAEITAVAADGRIETFSHVERFKGAGAGGTEGCAFKAAEIARA